MESVFFKNDLEKPEFSINEEAQSVIQDNIEHIRIYKLQTLQAMIASIDRCCEKNKTVYYAVGKLLTYCVKGLDAYPEDYTYEIKMLRHDYDLFVKDMEVHAKQYGVTVKPMYYEDEKEKYITTSLTRTCHEESEEEYIDFTIEIKIIPMDTVPADKKKRQRFYKKVNEINKTYRGYTKDYIEKYGTKTPADPETFSADDKKHYDFHKHHENLSRCLSHYSKRDTGYYGRLEMVLGRFEKKSDIFPIEKMTFGDTYLYIPSNTKEFLLPGKAQYHKEFRMLQKKNLEAFDTFCQDNHIAYFAANDLLIAISCGEEYGKGKINNWRLGLLRDDYNKAIKLLAKVRKTNGLVLKTGLNEYPFVPSLDKGVLLQEYDNLDLLGRDSRIILDVYDYLPETAEARIELKDKLQDLMDQRNVEAAREKGLSDPKQEITVAEIDQKLQELAAKASDYPVEGKLANVFGHFAEGKSANIFGHSAEGKSANIFDVFGYSVEGKSAKNSSRPTEYVAKIASGKIKEVYHISEILPIHVKNVSAKTVAIDRNGEKTVLVPNNEFLWHNKKDPACVKQIMDDRARLLTQFHKICEEEGIQYFAIDKLLIGSVVYHDFIPGDVTAKWKVALVREEYEKLIKLDKNIFTDFGLKFVEYLDPLGHYPLQEAYLCLKDKDWKDVRIYLLPYDKLPQSFYLKRALLDELKEERDFYQEILDFNFGNANKYKYKLSTSEIATKISKYCNINASEVFKKMNTCAMTYNDDEDAHDYGCIVRDFGHIMKEDSIYPLQLQKFHGMNIWCPNNYSDWQPVQDEELVRQVTSIQKVTKQMMVEVDRVCQKLHIGYFICGGTLLGYMRHKGFIPWDDDIDIAMLRSDYERFLECAQEEFAEGYFLQKRSTDPNIPYLFSKVRLDGTEYYTEYIQDRDIHKGICIDVFPFDYMPKDSKKFNEIKALAQIKAKKCTSTCTSQYPDYEDPFPPRNEKERDIIEAQKAKIRDAWKINLSDLQKDYEDIVMQCNPSAKKKKLCTVASHTISYTQIDLKDLLPYHRGTFEDIQVSVPKRPDVFLSRQYGDYMQLPAKHQQIAHRLVRWNTGTESGSKDSNRSRGQ